MRQVGGRRAEVRRDEARLPEVEGMPEWRTRISRSKRPKRSSPRTLLPEELYRIGLIYSEGMDVAVDLVAAHKWFNLAATRGHRDASSAARRWPR